MPIPSELLLMESPWGFHEQKFGILNSNRIPNSELLPLKLPWQFHERKFGIRNSIALFDFYGQISQKRAMEFQIPNFSPWNRHSNSMSKSSESASPWAEVQAHNETCSRMLPYYVLCSSLGFGSFLPVEEEKNWKLSFNSKKQGVSIQRGLSR